MITMSRALLLRTTTLILVAPSIALAEDQQSLEQAASDPTASLMSVQLQDNYSGNYHNLSNEDGNQVLLRSAVPFKTGDLSHIARVTLPFITDAPSGETGMGDMVLFDLVTFNQPWGRWGVGPVLLAPTATHDELGSEKWAAGPALGFVAASEGRLLGLFNQNLITFAGNDDREDVNVSILQPIVNFSLPNKWAIGSSEMNFTYDWEKNAWSSLPIGVKLSKLMKLDKVPVQLSSYYEYNLQDDYIAPEWTVNFTAKFLFPLRLTPTGVLHHEYLETERTVCAFYRLWPACIC